MRPNNATNNNNSKAAIPSEAGFTIKLAKVVLEHSPLAVCVLDALSNADVSALLTSRCPVL